MPVPIERKCQNSHRDFAHGRWFPVAKEDLAEEEQSGEDDRRSDYCRSVNHQFSTRGFSTRT